MIIPARDAANRVGIALRDWCEHFRRVEQQFTIIVVDDGTTDDTSAVVERLREKNPQIKLLRHEKPMGFGACLRTALAEVTDPLVAYLTLDYPYRPGDLPPLLKRFEQTIDVYGTMKPVAAVSGCRTGVPIPAFWKFAGRLYRIGTRIVLGFKPEPLQGWLGLRNHWRSWWLWPLMGVPLWDVTSGLKVFRRELFDRFPIQSDGDFAHAEILAKLTFLGTIIAEEQLSPRSEPISATDFAEFGAILRNAKFNPLPKPC